MKKRKSITNHNTDNDHDQHNIVSGTTSSNKSPSSRLPQPHPSLAISYSKEDKNPSTFNYKIMKKNGSTTRKAQIMTGLSSCSNHTKSKSEMKSIHYDDDNTPDIVCEGELY